MHIQPSFLRKFGIGDNNIVAVVVVDLGNV